MSVKAQKQATRPLRQRPANHRRKQLATSRERYQLAAFPTELGWCALLATQDLVVQLVIGRASAAAALSDVDTSLVENATPRHTWKKLILRLQQYARGQIVDFTDVPLDISGLTPFQQAIYRECRKIPYGQTLSYGELAKLAGSPRAARAVGSTMAGCRQGIVVPCHRVVTSSGALGGYGGPTGVRFKRQLLELEAQALNGPTKPRSKAARRR
jgi:O-6-methylguanine DNA methyltransferase